MSVQIPQGRASEPFTVALADDHDWIGRLTTPGAGHAESMHQLHQLLMRAARHQVMRMRGQIGTFDNVRVEEIINQAADEAMVSLLGKLSTFEGRSQFSTWAYKFGILQAAVEVRRSMWRHREVPLEDVADPASTSVTPEQHSEATDFCAALSSAIDVALTGHQRNVVIALLVDEVPIDVLAERLGSSRNALYKTLHDARVKLRGVLTASGYLTAETGSEAIR